MNCFFERYGHPLYIRIRAMDKGISLFVQVRLYRISVSLVCHKTYLVRIGTLVISLLEKVKCAADINDKSTLRLVSSS